MSGHTRLVIDRGIGRDAELNQVKETTQDTPQSWHLDEALD
jgi:hypothetical protein